MLLRKHFVPLARLKERAHQIRSDLHKKGKKISHSQALEQVAVEFGYRNWNTAAAILSNYPDIELNIGDHVHGCYLGQDFKGRVLSVTEQGHGSHYRITLDLDEAVDVVTFDSFSCFRKRIKGQIDRNGYSPSKTSNGNHQLAIFGHVHK